MGLGLETWNRCHTCTRCYGDLHRRASSQMAEAVSERVASKLRLQRQAGHPATEAEKTRRGQEGLSGLCWNESREASQPVGQEATDTHRPLGSPEHPSWVIFPTAWLRKPIFVIAVTSSFLHGG